MLRAIGRWKTIKIFTSGVGCSWNFDQSRRTLWFRGYFPATRSKIWYVPNGNRKYSFELLHKIFLNGVPIVIIGIVLQFITFFMSRLEEICCMLLVIQSGAALSLLLVISIKCLPNLEKVHLLITSELTVGRRRHLPDT